MSKNVAVFVDVANIFYAAKAAGVDIDYVTLLKSATAGRDFVRAYAYTGLDPENENQKQFHGFLARSGYKVVSKDIRKYGDGRVKANLDIELVVDLMRMAEKLDVAVVISGDGDFAPAIYAVQQQGVRVEVISFRGNTSSDLIDAADVFIDIATVAKVEKGVRSGRRVAAEGDLSMTEVPDKESGVTPRRRRRESDEKPERTVRPSRRRGSQTAVPSEAEAAVPDVARPAAALVALPGERLSRGPVQVVAPVEVDVEVDVAEIPGETQPEEGHRRRRRRGGRGRGRGGRGAEADQVGEAGEAGDTSPDESEADIPEFADEVLPLPQHSGFGSVWDSQIGVAPERRTGPAPVTARRGARRRSRGRGRARGARVPACRAAPAGPQSWWTGWSQWRLSVGHRPRALRRRPQARLPTRPRPSRQERPTDERRPRLGAGHGAHRADAGRRSLERGPAGRPGDAARRAGTAAGCQRPGRGRTAVRRQAHQQCARGRRPRRTRRPSRRQRRSRRPSPSAATRKRTSSAPAEAATTDATPRRGARRRSRRPRPSAATRKRTSSAPAEAATTDATPVEAPAPVEEAKPKRTTRKRTTKPAEASEA